MASFCIKYSFRKLATPGVLPHVAAVLQQRLYNALSIMFFTVLWRIRRKCVSTSIEDANSEWRILTGSFRARCFEKWVPRVLTQSRISNSRGQKQIQLLYRRTCFCRVQKACVSEASIFQEFLEDQVSCRHSVLLAIAHITVSKFPIIRTVLSSGRTKNKPLHSIRYIVRIYELCSVWKIRFQKRMLCSAHTRVF